MSEPEDGYWCLLCTEDAPKFDTVDELFEHIKNTVHRDDNGGIIIYNAR